VVKHIADRVAVMNLGCIVETAETQTLFSSPRHPYSRALLSAIPQPQPHSRRTRMILEGEMPSALAPPPGCRFHTRCPFAVDRCRKEAPGLVADDKGHAAACHRIAELPPAEGVVPSNAGYRPALEKLVAAFSASREAASMAGLGMAADNVKSISPNV
jgi:oligopeptide/dipeptide ABC transporter ATP-binding protein